MVAPASITCLSLIHLSTWAEFSSIIDSFLSQKYRGLSISALRRSLHEGMGVAYARKWTSSIRGSSHTAHVIVCFSFITSTLENCHIHKGYAWAWGSAGSTFFNVAWFLHPLINVSHLFLLGSHMSLKPFSHMLSDHDWIGLGWGGFSTKRKTAALLHLASHFI